jgi:type I restriction enzyme R subunit
MQKEAQARIKINKLLEEAGWRFLPSDQGRATVLVEGNVRFDDLGETNFSLSSTRRGLG